MGDCGGEVGGSYAYADVAELSFSAGKSELLIRREVVRYETAQHCTEQGSTVHAKIVVCCGGFSSNLITFIPVLDHKSREIPLQAFFRYQLLWSILRLWSL